ncbi:class I SAM-dependent methyltransferase [Actinomadura latina]|uniref:Class I SAM-dependent methyltransferase n=1 Tax=Actinomadura latina TaxID=163603 RepID=A0A846YRJ5_9ACTN|nr:class I SAM-dependent methyltransferase [Actinomadura latina]NKZ03430.1 class I SAM-dependent methyltransferase [Actinomadura latina]
MALTEPVASVAAELARLTAVEIRGLDFSRVVALVNEPNMPSGGGATVRRVIELAAPKTGRPILEVGSNTGYSSIEFASWVDAPVTGVDINPVSNEFARRKAAAAGVDNVSFVLGDGLRLPFPDASFDLVFCSNVTSFMADHRRARDEYYRVLANRGALVVVPIYYRTAPPETLRRSVEEAIGAPLPVTTREYWEDVFARPEATLIADEPYVYERQTRDRISAYVDRVVSAEHLAGLPEEKAGALREQLRYFYELFDENLTYAGFSIMVFRKGHPNPEPVLHRTRPAAAVTVGLAAAGGAG